MTNPFDGMGSSVQCLSNVDTQELVLAFSKWYELFQMVKPCR